MNSLHCSESFCKSVSVTYPTFTAVTQTFSDTCDTHFAFYMWRLHVTSTTVHFSKNCASASTMELSVQNKHYNICKKDWKWEELKLMQDLLTKLFLDKVIQNMIFDYNQQDANIFDYLFLKVSPCFGRFLRPSSGARNCTFNFTYCRTILLQAGIAAEINHDTNVQQYWLTIPEAECTVMCSWGWTEEPSETCRAF